MFRHTRVVTIAILSVAVLFVGLAGTATAAKLLTGKDIKNGSITGKDIKNGTVASKDIKNGTIAGTDIKTGSIAGSKLNDSAKTTVRFAEDSTTGINLPTCTDTALDDCTSLLSVPMGPGHYVVTASGSIDNLSAVVPEISNRCGIQRGTTTFNDARFALAANTQPGEVQSFSLQQVVKTGASGAVSLRCTEMPGEQLRVSEVRLTVVKVGKVG
jgi:hypothetical protein